MKRKDIPAGQKKAIDVVFQRRPNVYFMNEEGLRTKRKKTEDMVVSSKGLVFSDWDKMQLDERAKELNDYNQVVMEMSRGLRGKEMDFSSIDWVDDGYLEKLELYKNFIPFNGVILRYFLREVLYVGELYMGLGKTGYDYVEITYHGASGQQYRSDVGKTVENPFKFQGKAVIISISESNKEILLKAGIVAGSIICLDVPLAYCPIAASQDIIDYKTSFKYPSSNLDVERNIKSAEYGWGHIDAYAIKGLINE